MLGTQHPPGPLGLLIIFDQTLVFSLWVAPTLGVLVVVVMRGAGPKSS
jgi:hypothetical protein